MALAKKCKDDFYFFVQTFWGEIIAELPVWNWHIKYLCDELQLLSKSIVARDTKPYDLLINIPPGTTKSTIVTQMFPAWLWTQDPTIRIISNSFSATLATDHAMRSRDIILSDKFKKLFPDVKLRDDKSAKTFYANTLGGSRYSTSTSGGVTGEHAHCLVGETKLITTKGSKQIKDIKAGDYVLSFDFSLMKFVYDKVLATRTLTSNEIYGITIGTNLVKATGEHRFFVRGKGWTYASDLIIGDECVEVFYIKTKGKFSEVSASVTNIEVLDYETFVYDIQTEITHNFFAENILVHNCILNDDPQNPRQAFSEAFRKAAVEHLKTLATRKVDKANTPTITVMQRLHELDVTGFLLENSTEKIKHICLPAELSPLIKPIELRSNYVDGLLDPIRLNREVLAEMRSDLGAQNYSGQFEQNPVAEGGNIVKRDWFKIVDTTTFAAIYKMQPVHFFVDTAYTSKQDNDPTGILAACKIRNDIYITGAQKVRKEFPELISFLKKYTSMNGYDARSTLRIEPKANGLSVIQQLKAQTNLNVVSTPTPKDSKEVRLHTSSPTIEAGHVCLVAGAWNDEFLTEVCGFPAMAHDEYVDLLNYAIDYFILKEVKTIDSKMAQGFFW